MPQERINLSKLLKNYIKINKNPRMEKRSGASNGGAGAGGCFGGK